MESHNDSSRQGEDTNDSFPISLNRSPFNQVPPSVTSSGTYAASDMVADNSRDAGQDEQTSVPSLTGPTGESGLPPSRPTSPPTSMRSRGGHRTSLVAQGSRRGFGSSMSGTRTSKRDSGGTGTESDIFRPASAMSRTHVPSLTQQGFLRPLSSQKLQAQRNQRPASSLADAAIPWENRGEDDQKRRSRRYSNASIHTLRERPGTGHEEDVPPVPNSRDTVTTGGGDIQAFGQQAESEISNLSSAPLRERHVADRYDANGASGVQSGDRTPLSPTRSLRVSLGLGSRTDKQDGRTTSFGGHEKLASRPSTPNEMEKHSTLFATPTKGNGKNHEYFSGNMLFFLRGRCLNTRAKPLNVATFLLTLLPGALFFVFEAPWLWTNVSPALPIVFAYIFALCISSFLHAAFSDPGILPRNLHPQPPNPDEERDPLTVGPPTTDWIMVKTFPSASRTPLPGQRSNGSSEEGASTNGGPATAMEVPTKYCKSCSIWRPLRAHHCRVCDTCVETQDHHCVWLNNCVGRRNYRYFFSYVGSATLLALMLIALSILQLVLRGQREGIGFGGALSGRLQERMAFFLFIYSVLALPYPGSLFVYHIFLMARGETTREYLNSHKFLQKDRHRPFTQASMLANWVAVLMRPRPPGYLQFKRRYEVGDLRLGHQQPKKQRRKELKESYSVQGPGTGAGARDKGVEMKDMQQSNGSGNLNGAGPPRNGSRHTHASSPRSTLGVGGINNTPR